MKTITHITRALLFAAVTATTGCGTHDMMPNPPTDLAVSELSGGAHLTWKDNSDNEASFMVERKVGDGSFAELITVPFDTTSHHDAPLTAGTTYTYRVMAMPKSGHTMSTEYSNEATLMFVGP
jgi:hypothetical protein